MYVRSGWRQIQVECNCHFYHVLLLKTVSPLNSFYRCVGKWLNPSYFDIFCWVSLIRLPWGEGVGGGVSNNDLSPLLCIFCAEFVWIGLNLSEFHGQSGWVMVSWKIIQVLWISCAEFVLRDSYWQGVGVGAGGVWNNDSKPLIWIFCAEFRWMHP